MTKQIQFTKTGSPDVLQIVDVQIPAPKSGEVQIKMHALGLNRAEMMYREGAYVIERQWATKGRAWLWRSAMMLANFKSATK